MAAKTKTAKCTFLSEDLHIKMCKKIADLTRVVDKLFRSHYEQSIDYETIKDRQTKIQSEIKEKDVKIIALNKTVQELRDKLLLLETSKEDNEQVTNELQSKLNSINSLYEEERKENDILKQQLAERQQPEEEKSFNNDKECTLCSELNCELIELKEQLQNLQNDTKKLKKEAKNITQDKTKLNEKLQSSLTEITLLKEQLTHSQSLVGQYQSNNEELTTTIARLKEKLANIQCSKAMTVQHQPAAHVKKQKRQYWLETTPIKVSLYIIDLPTKFRYTDNTICMIAMDMQMQLE